MDLILEFIISLDVKVSSKSSSPIMFLKVVLERFSNAVTGSSTPYVNNFGSVTWKKTIVSICIVTLSFVITGWGGKSATFSFKETVAILLSIIGIIKWIPAPRVLLYLPNFWTITVVAWWTTTIDLITKIRIISAITDRATIKAMIPGDKVKFTIIINFPFFLRLNDFLK